MRKKIIAIDFDGTIYDKTSKLLLDGAYQAIKELHQKDYILVLWTCRTGRRLTNAINILKKYDLFDCFECVNDTPLCVKSKFKISSKVWADIYINDRNITGFIGWEEVLKILR